jgi:hypothetical protein
MEAKMDPITDIFRTMHVTAFGQHRLEATAPWGVKQEKQTEEKVTPSDKKMSPTDLAHFAMLSRGNCWLSVEGIPEPIPLTGGDCFLLARGTSIVLRDSLRTRPRWNFREIGAKANNNVAHYGGGGAPTTIVCGSFSFDRASLKPITQLLPSFILIKAEQARTLALHNTIQALALEMAEQAPGSEVVATRLAEVLFIQVLRAHIASRPERNRGWLRASASGPLETRPHLRGGSLRWDRPSAAHGRSRRWQSASDRADACATLCARRARKVIRWSFARCYGTDSFDSHLLIPFLNSD